MVFTHTIPAANVREVRHGMRESLDEARQQVREAHTPEETAAARVHLSLVREVLNALGHDDREPEVDVPVQPIREALRGHLRRWRELPPSEERDLIVAQIEHMLPQLDA